MVGRYQLTHDLVSQLVSILASAPGYMEALFYNATGQYRPHRPSLSRCLAPAVCRCFVSQYGHLQSRLEPRRAITEAREVSASLRVYVTARMPTCLGPPPVHADTWSLKARLKRTAMSGVSEDIRTNRSHVAITLARTEASIIFPVCSECRYLVHFINSNLSRATVPITRLYSLLPTLLNNVRRGSPNQSVHAVWPQRDSSSSRARLLLPC